MIAIDLRQPKLPLRAYAAVEKLVTCRAEHPKHVTLRVADERPRAVARKFRLVRDLEDARLSAAFARRRDIRMSAAHPVKLGVLVRATGIVLPLSRGIAPGPYASKVAGRFARAVNRTIAAIGAWWNNVKMRAAARTIAAIFRNVGLLATPSPTSPPGASGGAISPVWPLSLKSCGAFAAGQIVHSGALA